MSTRSQSSDLAALLEVVRLVEEERIAPEELHLHNLQAGSGHFSEANQHGLSRQFTKRSHNRSQSSAGTNLNNRVLSDVHGLSESPDVSGSLPSSFSSCRLIPGGPCFSCRVTEAPQWRRPDAGNMLLCNRCGIHYMRYKQLPGPKKEAVGIQAVKPVMRGSPTAAHSVKRKANAMPEEPDEDGCRAHVCHSPVRPPQAPAIQLASSAPSGGLVFLQKTHVRRHPGSILQAAGAHAPPATPVDGIAQEDTNSISQTATVRPRLSVHAEPSVSDAQPTRGARAQRRLSTGPVLQTAAAPAPSASSSKPGGVLDIDQLHQFLLLTQTMTTPNAPPQQPATCSALSALSNNMPPLSKNTAVNQNATSAPPQLSRFHSAPAGAASHATAHPLTSVLPSHGGVVCVVDTSALPGETAPNSTHQHSGGPVKHSAPIPVPAAPRPPRVDGFCLLPRRVSRGPPTGSSPIGNSPPVIPRTNPIPQQHGHEDMDVL